MSNLYSLSPEDDLRLAIECLESIPNTEPELRKYIEESVVEDIAVDYYSSYIVLSCIQIQPDLLFRAAVIVYSCLCNTEITSDGSPSQWLSEGRGAGYVYTIESGGKYKVGKSGDPAKRIKSLRTGSPYPINAVSILETPCMDRFENNLHAMFSRVHIRGEWFNLHDGDVMFLKNLQEAVTRYGKSNS